MTAVMSHDRETTSLLMIEIRYFICTFRSIMIEFLQWGTFLECNVFWSIYTDFSFNFFTTTVVFFFLDKLFVWVFERIYETF